MPRPLRIEYPGAIYHVMNRGDRREPIFKDDVDRLLGGHGRWLAGVSAADGKRLTTGGAHCG